MEMAAADWTYVNGLMLAVAIGTILAAGFAGFAAYSAIKTVRDTESLVRVGQDQVKASEAILRTSIRPVIADVPPFRRSDSGEDVADASLLPVVGTGTPTDRIGLRVPVRNIGSGAALVTTGNVQFTADVTEAVGEMERGIMGAGEHSSLDLTLLPGHPSFLGFRSRLLQQQPVIASVRYSDVAGFMYRLTLTLSYDNSIEGWRVTAVLPEGPLTESDEVYERSELPIAAAPEI